MEHQRTGKGSGPLQLRCDQPPHRFEAADGLHRELRVLLLRGHHPMAELTRVGTLLLRQDPVGVQMLLDPGAHSEGGVVGAFRAVEGPAVAPPALDVVLRIVGAGRVHYSRFSDGPSLPDEAAALPLRSGEIVGGRGPCDQALAIRLGIPISVWESMVHIGRIHRALEGQLPDVAHDGMLMVGRDPVEKLVIICFGDACSAPMSVLLGHAIMRRVGCSALARAAAEPWHTGVAPRTPSLKKERRDADDGIPS